MNKQRELITLMRQGTQRQRPESPTVTPPGIRVNTGYINSTKGTSSDLLHFLKMFIQTKHLKGGKQNTEMNASLTYKLSESWKAKPGHTENRTAGFQRRRARTLKRAVLFDLSGTAIG